MKKNLLILIMLIILTSCNNSKNDEINKDEIIIDIKNIAGKNKTEVDKILGNPEKTESFTETICKKIPCEKAYYKNNKFEIIFINGKADWITINQLSDFNFDENKISLLGFPKSSPDFINLQDGIRWKNIENIKEINIFNNGLDKISYAYIKVSTE